MCARRHNDSFLVFRGKKFFLLDLSYGLTVISFLFSLAKNHFNEVRLAAPNDKYE